MEIPKRRAIDRHDSATFENFFQLLPTARRSIINAFFSRNCFIDAYLCVCIFCVFVCKAAFGSSSPLDHQQALLLQAYLECLQDNFDKSHKLLASLPNGPNKALDLNPKL